MEDKFAVVTGASTGIGRAIAVEPGKNGTTIALVARRKDKLEETKELVDKVGGKAIIFEKESTKKVDILLKGQPTLSRPPKQLKIYK